MSDKLYLYRFPEARFFERREVVQDPETKTYLPQMVTVWISPISGLNEAFRQVNVLQSKQFDLFDVIDFRKQLKDALDPDGRRVFDDRFMIVTENQKNMVEAAFKAYDWTQPRPVGDGYVETVMVWLDWVEFTNAIRNPSEYDAKNIPQDYAQWLIDKKARIAAEEATATAAVATAAAGEVAAPVATAEVTSPEAANV